MARDGPAVTASVRPSSSSATKHSFLPAVPHAVLERAESTAHFLPDCHCLPVKIGVCGRNGFPPSESNKSSRQRIRDRARGSPTRAARDAPGDFGAHHQYHLLMQTGKSGLAYDRNKRTMGLIFGNLIQVL